MQLPPATNLRAVPARHTDLYRIAAGFVLGILLCCQASSPLHAADAPGGKQTRSATDIRRDLSDAGNKLADVLPAMESLYDSDARGKLASKVTGPLHSMHLLLQELSAAEPASADNIRRADLELLTWLTVLGDNTAKEELTRQTVLPDVDQATDAKASLILARWIGAQKDATEQEKLALELSNLTRSRPENASIPQVIVVMTETAATPAMAEQAEQIILRDFRHPSATAIADQLALRRKLRSLVGQPLQFTGTTLEGKPFDLSAYSGEVVLVDFWATWSPSCRAELPKLKKAYADYHAKGLEIVGVSSDRDVDDLKGFLAENKDMTWPQLFDPKRPQGHPLAEKLAVQELPTMLILDRKGIVRTVKGQLTFEELVPQLLSEK